MTETPLLEGMEYDNLSTSPATCELLDEKGTQKISVSDQINGGLQHPNMKSDSFIVDMERFSHLTSKDGTLNSRINLQRSLSRKGSQRGGGEKKMNPISDNETDSGFVATFSPRAALVGATTPEKSMVVTVGTAEQPMNPQVHHQITIKTGNAGTTAAAESRLGGKRFSFRRSSPSWTIDPRRMLFFFATLSSMGTMLLIYFTLSMGKLNRDDSSLN